MPTKALYLLRHAKSDRSDPTAADFDRPLAPRGRRDAPLLAAHMQDQGYHPALILCSPARRTRETLELMQPAIGPKIQTKFDRKLYLASPEALLQQLRAVADKIPSVLLI